MKEELLSLKGKFQIWSYAIGHGQLLLRSTKNFNRATQIDILFSNVAAICLPAVFDDIEISEANESDFSRAIQLGLLSFVGRKIYRIAGVDVDGYVVAGDFAWDEGNGEYDSISPLI